ncbi:DUF4123 domain-containing protein [Halopseudomonas pelagia]|uniref:DUF4123 domain-containing protein n=1 Tax=Halopseudomonas pelagia TaxID=553151 RepID=UPI000A0433B4|nr:DUF4123 domain-containing protein [Halopseudomonas pelagia]
MIEYHYAIVEQPISTDEMHARWASCLRPRLPLMQQGAFQHLQNEGPWLVSLDSDVSTELASLQSALGSQAVVGWISSFLPAEKLSQHLSQTLVAKLPDGKTVLLRTYTPRVISALHTRNDCSWHASLFGPINRWWVKDGNNVQHFEGGKWDVLPEYQCIALDEPLLEALAVDQQSLELLEQIEASAPAVFLSSCHGDKLIQVKKALNCARQSGLNHPDDQLLFATLSLLQESRLDHATDWPEVLNKVVEQGLALSDVLSSKLEGDFA